MKPEQDKFQEEFQLSALRIHAAESHPKIEAESLFVGKEQDNILANFTWIF